MYKKKIKKIPKWSRRRPKKRKFVKPLTGLKNQGPSNQVSHAGIRYHKGFVHDKLRHTVLTSNQMPIEYKELILATLKTITTGPQAMTLPDGKNGWAYKVFKESYDRSGVLSFFGFEVAVFYKRQLTEVKLEPGDRYPEGVLQDPEDAWQRLDLLGSSAKQANVVLTNYHKRLEEENKLLHDRVKTLDDLNDNLEKDIKRMKTTHLTMHKDMSNKIKEMTLAKFKRRRR